MGEKVEGGIRDNQNLVRFEAASLHAPVKDQLDLMSRNWFSLVPGRTDPIEHRYNDARSNREEKITISCTQPHGIATIHDQDLLIFVISQWNEANRLGMPSSRRVCFTPYQFFQWIGRTPTGSAYQRLKDALKRLSGTKIETTKHFDKGTTRRNVTKQFSWISEWQVVEDNGELKGIEIVLAEWLFESIQNFHVLTIDRNYFDIAGSMERWLYLYARKASGNPQGFWKEGFRGLYRKSASQQEYKHFKAALIKLIRRDSLPGIKLKHGKSTSGEDMLLMERIREQNAITESPPPPEQLTLIDKTPHEQHWENLLELMKRRIGEAETRSWIAKLEFRSFEGRVLTLMAPFKFIADQVTANYKHHLRSIWESFGHEVESIVISAPGKKVRAA